MKIKMLRDQQCAPDGFTIATYNEGETYDLPQSLAEALIREQWAVEPGVSMKPVEDEEKNAGSAPENKKRKAGNNRPV